MPSIETFTRLNIPKEEVFSYLIKTQNISKYISPFFSLERINCKDSNIDLDSYFIEKCVFLDSIQLFYKPKEIIENKKIVYMFEGLIKGTKEIDLISDGACTILKEKYDVSLYNQFSLIPIDFLISILFSLDSNIKHLRLKNIIYKDLSIPKQKSAGSSLSIRSYITIDSNIESINSFFEDLNKLALWISPYLKLDKYNNDLFSINFILPIFPDLSCTINTSIKNKVEIDFSNSVIKGKNIWSAFKTDHQLVVENRVELEKISMYLNLIWLILGNTLIKQELNNLNLRLKEVAEKTYLSQYLEASLKTA